MSHLFVNQGMLVALDVVDSLKITSSQESFVRDLGTARKLNSVDILYHYFAVATYTYLL